MRDSNSANDALDERGLLPDGTRSKNQKEGTLPHFPSVFT